MTRIGAGRLKPDKNNELFISVKLDEGILPLTITDDKMLIINPNRTKNDKTQPDYYIDIFVPKKKEETKETKNTEK